MTSPKQLCLVSFLCVVALTSTSSAASAQAIDNHVDLDRALEELERNPQSSYWNNQAALLYAGRGNLVLGLKHMEKAILLDPENPMNHCQIAGMMRASRNLSGSEVAVRRCVELDSDNPSAHFQLAEVLKEQGKNQESRAEYERTIQLLRKYRAQNGGEVYYDLRRNAYGVKGMESEAKKKLKELRKAA